MRISKTVRFIFIYWIVFQSQIIFAQQSNYRNYNTTTDYNNRIAPDVNESIVKSDLKKWMMIEIESDQIMLNYREQKRTYSLLLNELDVLNKKFESQKKDDIGFKSKDPFETTEAYNLRLKEANQRIDQQYREAASLLSEQIDKLNEGVFPFTVSKIRPVFKLEQYNADRSIWKINIEEEGGSSTIDLTISPEEARLLWEYHDQLEVTRMVRLNDTTTPIIMIGHPRQYKPIFLAKISNQNEQTFSSISSNNDDFKIYTKVEIEAEFPGGRNGWTRFLTNNLDSEVPGSNGANPGQYTVIVRFIVAKDGSVSDVQAETSHGYGMEQESVRAIKKSGRWTPALHNGRNVISYKRQPITWTVSE